MTRSWQTVDAVDTAEGRLELRRRGEREFVITAGGRVLMNSGAHRTEAAAAEIVCRGLAAPRPRVLIGGLGMGFTLRAALDALPRAARVVVAEIEPAILRWCRGPLAGLTGRAVDDPRVTVRLADVAAVIAGAASHAGDAGGAGDGGGARFDAIVLDLYEGPRGAPGADADPLYGADALARARAALVPGGALAVWSEDPDAAFEQRFAAAGFRVERRRPGRGGPRHTVYVGRVRAAGRGERPDRLPAAAGAALRPEPAPSGAPRKR
jgi:spermidine synthase